jgi:hypothetical protein
VLGLETAGGKGLRKWEILNKAGSAFSTTLVFSGGVSPVTATARLILIVVLRFIRLLKCYKPWLPVGT